MKIYSKINNVDFIDTEGNIINKSINLYSKGDSSKLLEYSEDALFFYDYNEPVVDKFVSLLPYFILIKIYKPRGVRMLNLKFNDTVIQKILFESKKIDLECILRFSDTGDSTLNLEKYIHENYELAHQDEIKDHLNDINKNSLVSKKLINDNYGTSENSQIVNSDLITKEMQIFNMGNLIHENDEFIKEV